MEGGRDRRMKGRRQGGTGEGRKVDVHGMCTHTHIPKQESREERREKRIANFMLKLPKLFSFMLVTLYASNI